MHKNKRVAIILPDTLQSIGLQSLLADYFPPVEVSCFPAFEGLSDAFDYYFTQPEIFFLNADFFLPRRNKTIILISGEGTVYSSDNHSLNMNASRETIIGQLQQVFISETTPLIGGEGNKELSAREIDVLQLIVRGLTNKDIADKLNISLNTVLSHRKNITSKLGIKTVSGLTFYAIMNGLVSPDDIEL